MVGSLLVSNLSILTKKTKLPICKSPDNQYSNHLVADSDNWREGFLFAGDDLLWIEDIIRSGFFTPESTLAIVLE